MASCNARGRSNDETETLGLGTDAIGLTVAEPTRVGSESDWIILSLAPRSTCGIRGNGTLWCWGSNEQGQLGLGASWSETPLAVHWP
jgi:alpha-tubulin suppressor-like RCC1 family protein